MSVIETVGACTTYRFSYVIDEKEVGRVRLVVAYNDLHEQPFGLLEDVFVEEDHRGKGYWSELWKHVMRVATRRKCYKLIATSRLSREDVHAMYEHMGFEKCGFEFRMDL